MYTYHTTRTHILLIEDHSLFVQLRGLSKAQDTAKAWTLTYLQCPGKSPVFFHDPSFLENEFPFFILLSFFVCFLILPAQNLLALEAKDIRHCVEPCGELPVFPGPNRHVHHIREEVGPPISSLDCTDAIVNSPLAIDM